MLKPCYPRQPNKAPALLLSKTAPFNLLQRFKQHVTRSKLVFITGASSGLGQALALRYYQAGYTLALVARRTSEIESSVSRYNIYPDSYKIYSADVAHIDSIEAGCSYRVIPWQMGVVAKLLKLMPNWLFDKALSGRPRKQRSIENAAYTLKR